MPADLGAFVKNIHALADDFPGADVNVFSPDDFPDQISEQEVWKELVVFILNERLGGDHDQVKLRVLLFEFLSDTELPEED